MPDVIYELCWEYRCEEAQAAIAEPGECTCPCHDMDTAAEVARFAGALRGDDRAGA